MYRLRFFFLSLSDDSPVEGTPFAHTHKHGIDVSMIKSWSTSLFQVGKHILCVTCRTHMAISEKFSVFIYLSSHGLAVTAHTRY